MSLHLVFSAAGLRACQERIGADDELLLLGDGVYAGTGSDARWPCTVHALSDDVLARGLAEQMTVPVISYAGFVALCTRHTPVVSWAR